MNNPYQKSQSNSPFDDKIQQHHLDRLAIIYVRQSTLHQVQHHSESTRLQYALKEKAITLGWDLENIVTIDDDLGQSGSNAEGRPGFQRLVAQVSLGRVGIVIGIEMSRLARSCSDWYQLLDVCALFRTLIGDADGIYDPSSYNSRLLLGLKGTMSEAELHMIKQRMVEGKNAKARRGDLKITLPVGYVTRPSGEITKDLDEQVQSIIQLIFELFDKLLTVNAVVRYLVEHRIRMPHRETSGLQKGELGWRRPNNSTLASVLHHPIYAGAYVYGRCLVDPRKKKPGKRGTGRVRVKQEDWTVLIKDKVPAYITWNQYERNKRQIAANSTRNTGTPRQGSALLSGLLVCGRCGLRMSTHYSTSGFKPCYTCRARHQRYGERATCQTLASASLDDFVVQQVLTTLKPCGLKVSLQVAQDVEQERKNLIAYWEKQLERTAYEVERAYRQYNAEEPENRLVVRTLSRQWEEALANEKKMKEDYAKLLEEQPKTLSLEEREAIRELASDIPGLWAASTTTIQQRKEVIRLLIERIIVTMEGKTEKVKIEIHWYGGYKAAGILIRPVEKLEHLSYYDKLIDRVTHLRKEGHTLTEISVILSQEGWKGSRRQERFTVAMVGSLLSRCSSTPQEVRRTDKLVRAPNEFTLRELSRKISIPYATLYAHLKKGILNARLEEKSNMWLITANDKEVERLQSLKNDLNEDRRSAARPWVKKVD